MAKNYGINYMGSKNVIAQDIVQYIISRHPDKTIFIDACCGGFAISHYVHRETNMTIYANDLNNYVVALLDEMLTGGKNLKGALLKWLSRDEVTDVLKNPENYPAWYAGFVQSTWTFGGQQGSYLYGKDKEFLKKTLFDAVVNNRWDESLKPLYDALPRYIKDIEDTSPNKRKALLNYYARVGDKTQLENLSRAERVVQLLRAIRYSGRIKLSALDYREFINLLPQSVLSDAVIYIDPPYQDTAAYAMGDIDYDAFWDFVMSLKDIVPVYVSSYNGPEFAPVVWSQQKIVNLNTTNQDGESIRNRKTEKLFYNKYPRFAKVLADLL